MLVDNNFIGHDNMRRLQLGIAGALILHALILIKLIYPSSQKIISADIFSPPTNITISLLAPIKAPPRTVPKELKIVKPIQKKPVIKKVVKPIIQQTSPKELSIIEPASPPLRQHQITKPVRNIIPVVSDVSIKGRRVQPEYPKRSLRLRQEGVVWLRVLISETGKRQDIKLHKPSQYALLNQAAIKAVKKWTFDPNIVNGRAVQSWVEIPIEFKIQ